MRRKGFNAQLHISLNQPKALTNWLSLLRSLAIPRHQRAGSTIASPQILVDRLGTKKVAEVSRAASYIHDVCQNRGITRA